MYGADRGFIDSACSCYIGKGGYCHHCHALGLTFLQAPETFVEQKTRPLEDVVKPGDMLEYLRGVTLDDLIDRLRARGIEHRHEQPTSVGGQSQRAP